MTLHTQHLGDVTYAPENVIYFEEGIPGFEDAKEFILVMSEQPELPFHYLQSIDQPAVVFIVTSPFLFVEHYDFELSDDIVEKLGIISPEEIFVYSVVSIPKKAQYTTINLSAPIIINTTKNKGKQVILEEIDDIRHEIFTKGVE